MHVLERLPQESDRTYAYRTIRDNIISLDLEPGSQISENNLASMMNISRTPVREALIEFSRVKIVNIIPQKRGTIALIDNNLVEEARFMRNVLECAVVELDCDLITKAGLQQLEEIIRLHRFYIENNNTEQALKLDDQFHRTLFEIAQKSHVYAMAQSMMIHFDRVRRMSLDILGDNNTVEDHWRILLAIQNHDPEKARQVMQLHLNRYKYDAKSIQQRFPQYFK